MIKTKKKRNGISIAEHFTGDVVYLTEEQLHDRRMLFFFRDIKQQDIIKNFDDEYTVIVKFRDYGRVTVRFSRANEDHEMGKMHIKAEISAPHMFKPLTFLVGVSKDGNACFADTGETLNHIKENPDLRWSRILLLPSDILFYLEPPRKMIKAIYETEE